MGFWPTYCHIFAPGLHFGPMTLPILGKKCGKSAKKNAENAHFPPGLDYGGVKPLENGEGRCCGLVKAGVQLLLAVLDADHTEPRDGLGGHRRKDGVQEFGCRRKHQCHAKDVPPPLVHRVVSTNRFAHQHQTLGGRTVIFGTVPRKTY